MSDLETVFCVGHELRDVIFYDPKEGKYYNRESDFYLSDAEAKAFGLAG